MVGGNEYGQCGEELDKKGDSGRTMRRDIVIPQRCASKLSVRQVCFTAYTKRTNVLLSFFVLTSDDSCMQVAAGGTHSVVLTREGHVWTWGQPWPPGDM